MSLKIVVVDYGMGNLHSVMKGIEKEKVPVILSGKKADLEKACGIVIPGVGAFPDGMRELRKRKLEKAIIAQAKKGKPVMGICLGMQLLFTESSEFGRHEGLGLIRGKVMKFRNGLKVPHMGWNDAKIVKKSRLLRGIGDNSFVYFVHSYYCVPEDEKAVLTKTKYGNTIFTSAVESGNVAGFQYHPEKSGEKALKIYRNFYDACRNAK
jgi:imidazole glycerol-phosphate synthase subunit HisH